MKQISKLWVFVIAVSLLACGGPEEKKMMFFTKGKALYEQGDYVKARLEFKNAIQIDPKFADGYFMLGMVELKTGNMRKAFGSFSKAVNLNPNHVKANIQLGKLYLGSNALGKAMERATFVLEKAPGNTNGLMLKASVLYTQKKYDSCEAILTDVLSKDPGYGPAYLLYGGLKMAQGNKKQAEKIFKDGITAVPENLPLRLTLAEFYTKQKRNDDAEAVYKELITLKPSNMAYRIILAQFYAKIGANAKAETTLKEIINTEPSNPNHRILFARFLASQKRVGEAEAVLREAVIREKEGTTALFTLGDFYMQWRKPALALETFQKIVNRDSKAPDALRAKNQMVKVHFSLKNYTRGEELLNSILDDNPGDLQAHSLMGDLAMVRRDGPRAVSEFRTVINANPDFAPGYFKLAQAHLLTNDTKLAKDTLKKCLSLNPTFIEARRSLARVHMKEGSYEEAEAELKTILQKHPADISALADLGDVYTMRDKAGLAESQYRIIINKYPENPLGPYKLGKLRMHQKKYAQAVNAFDQALALDPDQMDVFAAQINCYIAMAKPKSAISRCRTRLKKTPDNSFVCNILGEIYLSQKSYEPAIKAFNRSIDLKPSSLTPYHNLARAYAVQGKTDEAIAQFESRLQSDLKDVRLAFLLGILWETKNEISKAAKWYRRALNNAPDFIPAANNLAFLIAEEGGGDKVMEEALKLAQKAVDRFPHDPGIVDTLGWVYFQRGEYELAYVQLQKVLDKGVDSPVCNYHMGMVLYKQGRSVEARKYLEKALETPAMYVDKDKIRKVLEELG